MRNQTFSMIKNPLNKKKYKTHSLSIMPGTKSTIAELHALYTSIHV